MGYDSDFADNCTSLKNLQFWIKAGVITCVAPSATLKVSVCHTSCSAGMTPFFSIRFPYSSVSLCKKSKGRYFYFLLVQKMHHVHKNK